MATVLGTDLEVVQIYAPRTDKALNVAADGAAAALRRYSATRHPADLAKIPVRPGQTPRVYGVRMISVAQLAALQAERGLARHLLACRLGVAWTRGADGVTERPEEEVAQGVRLAAPAWADRLQALGGGLLLAELGEVVQRRAEIGDLDPFDDGGDGGDPLDRYAAPSGLRLPR